MDNLEHGWLLEDLPWDKKYNEYDEYDEYDEEDDDATQD